MQRFVNPFDLPGLWYKANFHTHSSVSDGILPPAERVAQYKKAGYSVLALTDHRKTQDITGLGDERILVISGMEVHPVCRSPKGWWHIVAVGVPRELSFVDPPASVNRTVSRIHEAGGVAILGHPAWCGQEFESFRHIRGLDAIEVWNSTCDTAGRPVSESEWADALDAGWRLPAVAVDDCHHAYTDDVAEGWTWLKMRSLTLGNVLNAVRTGALYASCGPVIHDFRIVPGRGRDKTGGGLPQAGGVLRIRCSPAAMIHFKGPPGLGARRRAEEDLSITSFSVPTSRLGGWPWPYVRAVVTDRLGRKAWTSPLYPGRSATSL